MRRWAAGGEVSLEPGITKTEIISPHTTVCWSQMALKDIKWKSCHFDMIPLCKEGDKKKGFSSSSVLENTTAVICVKPTSEAKQKLPVVFI